MMVFVMVSLLHALCCLASHAGLVVNSKAAVSPSLLLVLLILWSLGRPTVNVSVSLEGGC